MSWRTLAFWRRTGDEIAQRSKSVTLALAKKREREGKLFREVAETTGDREILEVAEAREEEARKLRRPTEKDWLGALGFVQRRTHEE